MRHGKVEYTYKEIAEELGVCKQRVVQLEKRALKKLAKDPALFREWVRSVNLEEILYPTSY